MKRDIEFLYEMGALRLMQRQWSRFQLPGVANNSEHMYRVVWTALIIAERENVKVNTEKIIKMAIAHDIAESRTGDVDYMSRQYVERHEDKAAADMLKNTSLEQEFTALLAEYEARKSLEAKIVKDADNLDVDLELREQWSRGHKLPTDWQAARKHVGTTKLFTKTAERLHKQIWQSNPQDWHLNSPNNRLNAGDWKNK